MEYLFFIRILQQICLKLVIKFFGVKKLKIAQFLLNSTFLVVQSANMHEKVQVASG